MKGSGRRTFTRLPNEKSNWMKRFLLVNMKLAFILRSSAAPAPQPSRFISRLVLILIVTILMQTLAQSQENKHDDYNKAIKDRTAKIINTLGITDSVTYNKALNTVMNQYFALNSIHEENKAAITAIKSQSLPKDQTEEAVKKQQGKKTVQLKQLHEKFIAQLKKDLGDDQVEKIKDGMTYRVFPITYAAYQDMLPALTTEQKDQIYNWLKEARELAMDAESSEKKHEVFGKYKGKINNYLSAAGYDMKKEGEEWQKRIKERDAAKKSQASGPTN
jgi:hypothetical protein